MATIDINKGIEAFDESTDFTRGNKDRKTYGKSDSTDQFHLGREYDAPAHVPAGDPPQSVAQPLVPEPKKFRHKLANGTVLEAATVEELAAQIEKSLQQTPAPPAPPVEFEDKPLYEPMEFKRKELSLAEQADILNLWKENPQKALRKLEEAEYGVPMDTILANLSRADQRELNHRQEVAAAEFVGECEDFSPTPANGKKLTAYLAEKGKPITKQNLLVAFRQLVAAGDKNLTRKVDEVPPPAKPAPDDDDTAEVPPPPTIVPSNQGRPPSTPQATLDVDKFASMTLKQQQEYFAGLRRRA